MDHQTNYPRGFTRYSAEELINRVFLCLQGRGYGKKVRWGAITETFGLGSTYAIELCRAYGFDPWTEISGYPDADIDRNGKIIHCPCCGRDESDEPI